MVFALEGFHYLQPLPDNTRQTMIHFLAVLLIMMSLWTHPHDSLSEENKRRQKDCKTLISSPYGARSQTAHGHAL